MTLAVAPLTARVDYPWNEKYLTRKKKKGKHYIKPTQLIRLRRFDREQPITTIPIPIPEAFEAISRTHTEYDSIRNECGQFLSDTISTCYTRCVDQTQTSKEIECAKYWRVSTSDNPRPCDLSGGSNNGQQYQCAPPIFHSGAHYGRTDYQLNFCRPGRSAASRSVKVCKLNEDCTPFNDNSDREISRALHQCAERTNGRLPESEPLMLMGPDHNTEAKYLPYQLCTIYDETNRVYSQGWNLLCTSTKYVRNGGFMHVPEEHQQTPSISLTNQQSPHYRRHAQMLMSATGSATGPTQEMTETKEEETAPAQEMQAAGPGQAARSRRAQEMQASRLRRAASLGRPEEYSKCKRDEAYPDGLFCIAECHILYCKSYQFETVLSAQKMNKPCRSGANMVYPELCMSVEREAMDIRTAHFIDGDYWIYDDWNNERANYYQYDLQIYELITISTIIGFLLLLIICFMCWLMSICIIYKWIGSKPEQIELERVEI